MNKHLLNPFDLKGNETKEEIDNKLVNILYEYSFKDELNILQK